MDRPNQSRCRAVASLKRNRIALVGRAIGVALEHGDRREWHVEFVGNELRKCGLDAVPCYRSLAKKGNWAGVLRALIKMTVGEVIQTISSRGQACQEPS